MTARRIFNYLITEDIVESIESHKKRKVEIPVSMDANAKFSLWLSGKLDEFINELCDWLFCGSIALQVIKRVTNDEMLLSVVFTPPLIFFILKS